MARPQNKLHLYNSLAIIFVAMLFILYPLIMHDKLFDVAETKRNWFVGITICFTVLIAIAVLIDNRRSFRKFALPDFLFFGFVLVNLISFILSDYKDTALWGIYSRNFGLFSIFFIALAYLLLRETGIFHKYISSAISIGGFLIAFIGILNFNGCDIFGVYEDMAATFPDNYISTLGHVNIYSSFFAITLPVAFFSYQNETQKGPRIMYGVFGITMLVGLVCGNSDSSYITLFVLFVMFLFSVSSRLELFTGFLFISISLLLVKLQGVFYVASGNLRIIDSITGFLLKSNITWIIIAFFAGCTIFFGLFKGLKNIHVLKRALLITLGCLAIGFIIFAFIKVDFNDNFANNRGFIWKRGFNLFTSHFSFKDIMFGVGPDAVQIPLDAYYGSEAISLGMEHYDNVHNEPLQYLLTLGVTGLVCYIGFIAFSVRKALKINKSNPSLIRIAFVCSVLCYLAQSLVNVNQMLTTPLLFICLGLLNSEEK